MVGGVRRGFGGGGVESKEGREEEEEESGLVRVRKGK